MRFRLVLFLTLIFITSPAAAMVPMIETLEKRDLVAFPPTRAELRDAGLQLLHNETWGGNGRTCGMCHDPRANFQLGVKDVERLVPQDSPLFTAGKVLGDVEFLRSDAAVLTHHDGFDMPRTLRSIPDFFGAYRKNLFGTRLLNSDPEVGRDAFQTEQIIQWAIQDHHSKSLNRVEDVDFRRATDLEVKALTHIINIARPRNTMVSATVRTPRRPAIQDLQILEKGPTADGFKVAYAMKIIEPVQNRGELKETILEVQAFNQNGRRIGEVFKSHFKASTVFGGNPIFVEQSHLLPKETIHVRWQARSRNELGLGGITRVKVQVAEPEIGVDKEVAEAPVIAVNMVTLGTRYPNIPVVNTNVALEEPSRTSPSMTPIQTLSALATHYVFYSADGQVVGKVDGQVLKARSPLGGVKYNANLKVDMPAEAMSMDLAVTAINSIGKSKESECCRNVMLMGGAD